MHKAVGRFLDGARHLVEGRGNVIDLGHRGARRFAIERAVRCVANHPCELAQRSPNLTLEDGQRDHTAGHFRGQSQRKGEHSRAGEPRYRERRHRRRRKHHRDEGKERDPGAEAMGRHPSAFSEAIG